MSGADRIFINYRRADTRWAAARLYDGLSQRLGADGLFMDVDSIPPGVDFVEYLNDFVDRSSAIIVLIGPDWLTVTDETGQRRIDDPDDFVNIEICRAMERNVSVIPVLVDEASMPSEAELPERLKGLARRQAVRLDHKTYGQDLERLNRALGGRTLHRSGKHKTRKRNGWLMPAVGGAMTAVVAGVAILSLQSAPQPSAHIVRINTEAAPLMDVAGNWSSDYGSMTWTPWGASYDGEKGRITGAFDGQVFTGVWVEEQSDHPCPKAHKGSASWGRIELTFDPNFEFFQGQWSYCDIEPSTPWTGVRIHDDDSAMNSHRQIRTE